jgi:hypothetical protein
MTRLIEHFVIEGAFDCVEFTFGCADFQFVIEVSHPHIFPVNRGARYYNLLIIKCELHDIS